MSYAADSNAPNNPSSTPKNENPGTVTSDSLAAESIQGGGSFGANSDARGPMGQSSAGTNTNNTDTFGATELPAAVNRDAREAEDSWGEERKVQAGDGLGSGSGNGSGTGQTSNSASMESSSGGSGSTGSYAQGATGGYSDNTSSSTSSGNSGSGSGSTSGGSYASATGGSGSSWSNNENTAPSNSGSGSADFDNAPNASFTTDIGGKDDPGRAALGGMEARNARGAGGEGARQYGQVDGGDQGGFEKLGDDASA
ncbi:hypothetical protein B0A55_07665 [Friedmanniomyces simplex]|uniref:Uncharacterized protein n=1 Tax=Friedmanniomyces simplex TaxID=329884 RepID=A0A4U0X9E4_9PEZI|nr:hypothetical protein B0A55_07665 [Friedmanniomyces simplex]